MLYQIANSAKPHSCALIILVATLSLLQKLRIERFAREHLAFDLAGLGKSGISWPHPHSFLACIGHPANGELLRRLPLNFAAPICEKPLAAKIADNPAPRVRECSSQERSDWKFVMSAYGTRVAIYT